jgi:hypothetical protein
MDGSGFWAALSSSMVANVIIFLTGLYWHVIPKRYLQFLARRFWSPAVMEDPFAVCYSTLSLSPSLNTQFPFLKRFPDRDPYLLVGPRGGIASGKEMTGASYIISAISRFRGAPVRVITDEEAYATLDATYVALGSISSNVLTDFIMRESNNTFLMFEPCQSGVCIVDRKTGARHGETRDTIKVDYGVVLRLCNQRFPNRVFFVCAGLGEPGTSGAAWYLATHWRKLLKEFKGDFGIVLEVRLGSDQSARRIER